MPSCVIFRLLGCAFVLSSCGSPTVEVGRLTPKSSPSDGGSPSERRMAALVRGAKGQKRDRFIWDSRLHATARKRATDMGRRGYFNHVDPDGRGPNWHVSRSGYRLPIKWTAFESSNQIESILAGSESADDAYRRWIVSGKHRRQLLALNPFFEIQTRFGVARASVPGSQYGHYWVFISAPPEE